MNFLSSSFVLLICTLWNSVFLLAQKPDPEAYVQRYKDIAIAEMMRTGIPASIKLAQGILESAAGTSYLATRANNHFGIKCHKDWRGKKVWRQDDDYRDGKLVKSCFRAYKSPEESFVAHSEFLRDPKKAHRYGFLFELDPTDYKGWARGLKKAGYATAPDYDKKLIRLIETYNLHQFDLVALQEEVVITPHPSVPEVPFDQGELPYSTFPSSHEIIINNDAKLVLTRAGETPAYIAERVRVPVVCLLAYNEHLSDPYQVLEAGTPVYIQPKRNFWRGHRKWHYVKEGETMLYISNLYGIKLEKLYWRNRMPSGSEPAVGERIVLRGRVKPNEVPRLRKSDPLMPLPEDEFFDHGEVVTPDEPLPQTPETTPLPTPDEEHDTPLFEDPFSGQPVSVDTPAEQLPKNEDRPGISTPSTDEVTTPPVDVPQPPTPSPPVQPSTDDTPVYYTVVKGDTLYSIARRHGLSVTELKKLNGLSSNLIKPGQKLLVRQ